MARKSPQKVGLIPKGKWKRFRLSLNYASGGAFLAFGFVTAFAGYIVCGIAYVINKYTPYVASEWFMYPVNHPVKTAYASLLFGFILSLFWAPYSLMRKREEEHEKEMGALSDSHKNEISRLTGELDVLKQDRNKQQWSEGTLIQFAQRFTLHKTDGKGGLEALKLSGACDLTPTELMAVCDYISGNGHAHPFQEIRDSLPEGLWVEFLRDSFQRGTNLKANEVEQAYQFARRRKQAENKTLSAHEIRKQWQDFVARMEIIYNGLCAGDESKVAEFAAWDSDVEASLVSLPPAIFGIYHQFESGEFSDAFRHHGASKELPEAKQEDFRRAMDKAGMALMKTKRIYAAINAMPPAQ